MVAAMARARTADGHSPPAVVDLILGALRSVDNRSATFDSTGGLQRLPQLVVTSNSKDCLSHDMPTAASCVAAANQC